MPGLSRAEKNKEILNVPSWEGKACTDGIWEHETRPVVTGSRMRTMSRMPTMSLLMVIRVISACSREIGVENGKNKARTIT